MAEHNQVIQIEDSLSPPTTATGASSSSLPEYLKNVTPAKLLIFISIFTPLIHCIERFSVEKNIKVFYFLFALKKHIPYLLCSSLVLSLWLLLIEQDMNSPGIRFITSTLATFVIYTSGSMLEIVFVKEVDYWLLNKDFFGEMAKHISNEYFLQKIREFSRESTDTKMIVKLKRIKRAFTKMSHTICDKVESSNFSGHEHEVEHDISLVLKNLTDDEARDIQETDLLLVMNKEEVAKFLQIFDAATETKRITQESLRDWVTAVCNRRKHVVQLLNNTRQEIEQRMYVWLIRVYLVVVFWAVSMRIVTITPSEFLSPILIVFGKIFVDVVAFARVNHSVDIGDHCIIENEQCVVEDIRYNSTVLRKDNNVTVTLTNHTLSGKSIINLKWSSELKETFEIHISSKTFSDNNAALKLEIDKFISSKPENWHAEYYFNLIAAEDGKDMYNLEITNVRKFQNFKAKKEQRSEFILELKGIMAELGIVNFTIK